MSGRDDVLRRPRRRVATSGNRAHEDDPAQGPRAHRDENLDLRPPWPLCEIASVVSVTSNSVSAALRATRSKPADSITDVTCRRARNAPSAVHARPGASIRNPAESSAKVDVSAGHLVCGTPVALGRTVLDAVCVAASWIDNNEPLKRIAQHENARQGRRTQENES
jgi:hypothetical protein